MMKKRILALALIFVMLFAVSANALELNAKGACSINCETGEIYYEKNADVLMTPASLTKIMTLYIVFEKMAAGEFTEETLIPISSHAASISRGGDATNIPLTAGYSLPMRSLIDAMTIVSACACCTVVAEYISGSEEAFAQLMTQTAAQMGIEAYFYDASGLSDDNLISPKGVAQLVRTFIEKYPRILEYTSKTAVVINGKKYDATNRLLPIKKTEYYYGGADGFKTGTTTKAGKCLAATALRDGSRVISVAMKTDSNYYRYTDSIKLLDDAFYHALYLEKNMFDTDIRAFINGMEIPCSYKMFGTQELCITAEQLNFYGFNTAYDAQTHTLYISENPQKELAPIECVKGASGTPLHTIYEHPDLKAVLIKDGAEHTLKTVVSLGGQCAISFDELGAYYTKLWNNDTRQAEIFTK